MLPNFFIVGAPKAGTTSLYHYLGQHPDIYFSPIKEPCYFSSEVRRENFTEELHPAIERDRKALLQYLAGPMREKRPGAIGLCWESYLSLFDNAKGERVIGEASVNYLWSPTAAANIAAKIPHARILMMLRNPADRAFSQYLQTVTAGGTRRTFRAQMARNLRDRSGKLSRDYPFLELGMYYEQVKRYLALFPSEQICIRFYEEYQGRPAQTIAGIFRFLDVDSNFAPDMSERHLQPRIPRSVTAGYWIRKLGAARFLRTFVPRSVAYKNRKSLVMDPKDRAFLVDHYREDIQKLAGLLDRDLSDWLCAK